MMMNRLKKLQNKIKIIHIKLKARIPKLFLVLVNMFIIIIWAIAIMLILNIFLSNGIGLLEFFESLALYFVVEQLKPWVFKLNIYR